METESIGFGVVLPGGIPFSDGNVNPIFKCSMIANERAFIAYVKILDLRQIVIECLCSVIGRLLEIPIPKPYIVLIELGVLPGGNGERMYGFASEEVDYPSIKRQLNDTNQEIVLDLINRSICMRVASFDEWIANDDRNLGNVLFDGSDSYFFIDHGKSLPFGVPENLDIAINKLLYLYTCFLERPQLEIRYFGVAKPSIYDFIQLNTGKVVDDLKIRELLNDEEAEFIKKFLADRTRFLENMIAKKLNLNFKQFELIYE